VAMKLEWFDDSGVVISGVVVGCTQYVNSSGK